MSQAAKGTELIRLHQEPELLQVVNVWDVISATVIADLPGTKALATAGHSIAATFGYEDGENIPFDLHLDMLGRIAAAVELPVSADLEAGYGDAGDTVRRAVGAGIVGANIEDRFKPIDEAVEVMSQAVKAAEAEGVPFALNARTDAFVRSEGLSEQEKVAEAVARGKRFMEVGATSVFVPGVFSDAVLEDLVAGIGERTVSVIGLPGAQTPSRLQQLGVSRISYGPMTQRVALTALADTASSLYAGGQIPPNTRALN